MGGNLSKSKKTELNMKKTDRVDVCTTANVVLKFT